MTSGRWRFDNPLNQFYTKKQQKDPDLLLDDISEVPGAPQQREDYPPKLNADEGLAYKIPLAQPIPVIVIPGPIWEYRNFSSHGFTVKCFDGVPKQILSASDSRITAIVRNVGSGTPTIYVGSTADEARADGYPIEALDGLTIKGTGPMWGCVKVGDGTSVSTCGVFVEYAWPIG